nr:dockerin type I domain-containing protein [Paenibacillus sp. N3.4]
MPALDYGTGYYVLIDRGAFEDAEHNVYAGIQETTAWSFTTEVQSAPPAVSDFTKFAIGSGDGSGKMMFAAKDFRDHFLGANGSGMARIRIVSLPDKGVLKLGSAAVLAGDEIDAVYLADLVFYPPAQWTGKTSFTFQGSDHNLYSTAAATVELSWRVKGDINGDGKITNQDVIMLNNFIKNKIELSDEQKRAADMNNDGLLNAEDVKLLQENSM